MKHKKLLRTVKPYQPTVMLQVFQKVCKIKTEINLKTAEHMKNVYFFSFNSSKSYEKAETLMNC